MTRRLARPARLGASTLVLALLVGLGGILPGSLFPTQPAAAANCLVAPIPDVPANHPFCSDIEWMKAQGISTGFADGYRPSAPVTRQAMSAFMARLAGATLTSCASAPFADVAPSHHFCREIAWM